MSENENLRYTLLHIFAQVLFWVGNQIDKLFYVVIYFFQIFGLQPWISKVFSGSLDQFFLTVGLNNFGNKIPCICTGFYGIYDIPGCKKEETLSLITLPGKYLYARFMNFRFLKKWFHNSLWSWAYNWKCLFSRFKQHSIMPDLW